MTPSIVVFVICTVAVLGAALAVVTTRNLFHAALFLILSFFGVAGYYVLLVASFFAVAQVLVYIGAISILVIFSVMLTRGMQGMPRSNSQAGGALVACLVVFVMLGALLLPKQMNLPAIAANRGGARIVGGIPWRVVGDKGVLVTQPGERAPDAPALPADPDFIKLFGRSLVSPEGFALPFELASVLILLAMIGAIWVARERRPAEVLAERADLASEAAEEDLLPIQEALPLPEPAVASAGGHEASH